MSSSVYDFEWVLEWMSFKMADVISQNLATLRMLKPGVRYRCHGCKLVATHGSIHVCITLRQSMRGMWTRLYFYMLTSRHENDFRIHRSHRFPSQTVSNSELWCLLHRSHEQTIEANVELQVHEPHPTIHHIWVYGAWIKRYCVLCSKTYNTLGSLL